MAARVLRIVTTSVPVILACSRLTGPSAPTETQAARDMQAIIDRNLAQSGRGLLLRLRLRVEGCVADGDPHRWTCSAVSDDGARGIARVTYNADYTTWIASPE